MKKNSFQNNKIFISAILFIILSTLNYYNLKDKAFIKLEKYDVSINNELLANDLGSRIKIKNLGISSLKPLSKKMIAQEIKFDDNLSFITVTHWNKNTPDKIIKETKIKIYNEYKKAFKTEKENIQKKFLILKELYKSKTNDLVLDKLRLEETLYLRELNKYFLNLEIIAIESYLSINSQLKLIDEVKNNDFNIVNISKSFEKKEYLIFFAIVFNQLIIFIIVFFFHRSIPNNFKKI